MKKNKFPIFKAQKYEHQNIIVDPKTNWLIQPGNKYVRWQSTKFIAEYLRHPLYIVLSLSSFKIPKNILVTFY